MEAFEVTGGQLHTEHLSISVTSPTVEVVNVAWLVQ